MSPVNSPIQSLIGDVLRRGVRPLMQGQKLARQIMKRSLGCGTIAGLALAIAPQAAANEFRSNPSVPVDLTKTPQFSIVGELTRDEDLGDGTTAHIAGSAVIVSPCYVLTAFHVAFGRDEKPVPGKNYTANFRAGQGTEAGAFVGRTDAIPVVWGNYRDFPRRDDWAVLRLHNCVGISENFGWAEPTFHTQTQLIAARTPIVAVGYSYKNVTRAQQSMSFGRITGFDSRSTMMRFDASIAQKQSGGGLFAFEDGEMKFVGIITAEGHTNEDRRPDGTYNDSFDRCDPRIENLAQGVWEILHSVEVSPIIEADKLNRINLTRYRLKLPFPSPERAVQSGC